LAALITAPLLSENSRPFPRSPLRRPRQIGIGGRRRQIGFENRDLFCLLIREVLPAAACKLPPPIRAAASPGFATLHDSASSSGRTFSISLYLRADLAMRSTLSAVRPSTSSLQSSLFECAPIKAILSSTNESSCSLRRRIARVIKMSLSRGHYTIALGLLLSECPPSSDEGGPRL